MTRSVLIDNSVLSLGEFAETISVELPGYGNRLALIQAKPILPPNQMWKRTQVEARTQIGVVLILSFANLKHLASVLPWSSFMKASLSLSPRALIPVALAGVVAFLLLSVSFAPIHSIMAAGGWNNPKPTGSLPAFDDLPEFVEMKRIDKVYHVRVSVNDSLYFDAIVDSGASDLVVPNDIVRTLLRAEVIKASDFIGNKTALVADGREIPSQQFRVKSLKLGDTVVRDVVASTVSENAKSILLGQSVLSRFKTVTIDNEPSALLLLR